MLNMRANEVKIAKVVTTVWWIIPCSLESRTQCTTLPIQLNSRTGISGRVGMKKSLKSLEIGCEVFGIFV